MSDTDENESNRHYPPIYRRQKTSKFPTRSAISLDGSCGSTENDVEFFHDRSQNVKFSTI